MPVGSEMMLLPMVTACSDIRRSPDFHYLDFLSTAATFFDVSMWIALQTLQSFVRCLCVFKRPCLRDSEGQLKPGGVLEGDLVVDDLKMFLNKLGSFQQLFYKDGLVVQDNARNRGKGKLLISGLDQLLSHALLPNYASYSSYDFFVLLPTNSVGNFGEASGFAVN